jgi:metal-sulfur cluster biosynthetic enzyme
MTDLPDTIVDALRTVYDPCCREKGISVVDMGLVRSVAVAGDQADVQLILTTGWCPFATHLLTAITERIESLPEVNGAKVEIVWDEAWSTDRLSDEARIKLRTLPDPIDAGDRDRWLAARNQTGS